MSIFKILGFVIVGIGIAMLGFGINDSYSLTEKVVEGVSGHSTDNTMIYIISGIAMIIGGGTLALVGNKE